MITRREILATLLSAGCLRAEEKIPHKAPRMNTGLIGMYFNMPASSKEPPFADPAPAVVRIDPTIHFDWSKSAPSPRLGRSNFAVRWMGLIRLPKTGVYTLRLSHDRGLRIQVAGQVVYSSWNGRRENFLVDHSFDATGWVPIQVQYHALRSRAPHLRLDWAVPGTSNLIQIPPTAFAHVPRQQKAL